jgi:hypothetical protein
VGAHSVMAVFWISSDKQFSVVIPDPHRYAGSGSATMFYYDLNPKLSNLSLLRRNRVGLVGKSNTVQRYYRISWM